MSNLQFNDIERSRNVSVSVTQGIRFDYCGSIVGSVITARLLWLECCGSIVTASLICCTHASYSRLNQKNPLGWSFDPGVSFFGKKASLPIRPHCRSYLTRTDDMRYSRTALPSSRFAVPCNTYIYLSVKNVRRFSLAFLPKSAEMVRHI